MANYLSMTEEDRQAMLEAVGVKKAADLFADVPKNLRAKKLKLAAGKSEQETFEFLSALAKLNKSYDSVFLGAGSYNHYIPPVVKSIVGREEFVTAYTPYQAEMSQGILQAIFQYQTMICNLTGMDVSNASHYSGATAAAEACIMCADKYKEILTFDNINPDTLDTLSTYLSARGIKLTVVKAVAGRAVLESLENIGGVYIETPNYYGLIEDIEPIANLCHSGGGKLVLGCNPISLGLLKSPREQGADIAVGEGQPLGLPMSFGGPYLGYIATTKNEMRKMPGRIVGETVDKSGERAYVLTLQAREQHIRREKATSNICSNEAHCALTASVYLSAVGAEGLREVAGLCASNAHYFAAQLTLAGAPLLYSGEFFHEFVTYTKGRAVKIVQALDAANILGGLALDDDCILWCCTELNKKVDMDRAAKIAGGVK